MKKEVFDELLTSVREGGAILRGKLTPSRTFVVERTDIKRIRANLRLSQGQFATMMGISVATLRNWEQGRRAPDGPARVLLQIAAKHPEVVWSIVGRMLPRRKARATTRQVPSGLAKRIDQP